MENWEEILSDGKKKDPEPGSESSSTPTVSAEGESLFIVEGLTDPSAKEPELVPVDAPATPEEESQSEELTPISIDLGVDVPEMGPTESAASPIASGELSAVSSGAVIAQDDAFDAPAQEEFVPESGELEPVVSGSGAPKLFLWGSVAAGLICMVCAGLVWWKKSQPEMEQTTIAAAPVKLVKPASEKPIEAPKPVEVPAPVPVPVEAEEELAVVSPLPFEEIPEGETLLGRELTRSVGEIMGLDMPSSKSPELVSKLPGAPMPLLLEGNTPVLEQGLNPSRESQAGSEPTLGPQDRFSIRKGPAMVQLKNGNFFQGKIMNTTEQNMILRMPDGEMVFALEAIEQVLPIGSQGSADLFPSGYVELNNGNRVWGKIMAQGPESVTISAGPAKIVIPRPNVVNVKLGSGVIVRQESVEPSAGDNR